MKEEVQPGGGGAPERMSATMLATSGLASIISPMVETTLARGIWGRGWRRWRGRGLEEVE